MSGAVIRCWALGLALLLGSAGCRKAAATGQTAPELSALASTPVPPLADPELAAAERAAQAKLTEFRAALTRKDTSTQNLELEAFVEQGTLSERLWLNDVQVSAEGFRASVASQPAVVHLQRGQALEVPSAHVVDWAYEERGARRGAETKLIEARHKRAAELASALPQCTDKRFADGCAALGESYANGSVGEVKPDAAYQLFTKSCDGGSAYGCNAAAWASLHGRGTVANPPAAAAFFARACTTGDEHPFACDSRGFALLSGLAGTPRDTALAVRLLKKPCARGLAQSCFLLELLRAKQLWVGPKLTLACDVSISEQVSRCTGDKDPEACFLAGSAFETGVCGAPRSKARAAQFLAGAADFGASWSSAGGASNHGVGL